MANFSTHLNGAALISGLASTALLSSYAITPTTALWLWFLGTVGGLLPDIDSDNSTSMKTLFNLLAGGCSFLAIRFIYMQLTMLELLLWALAIYMFIRFVCKSAFEKLTVHRGSCHSLVFSALLSMITVCLIDWASQDRAQNADVISWLSGIFVFGGAMVHLLLDEFYSVDFSNTSLKASFGTALKFMDMRYPVTSIAQLVATVALFQIAPSPQPAIDVLTDWSHFLFWPEWLNIKFACGLFNS